MAKGFWEDALHDAIEVRHIVSCESFHVNQNHQAIELDISSPWGYETKCAALRGAGRHVDAVDTFEIMLSKMARSPDPKIRSE